MTKIKKYYLDEVKNCDNIGDGYGNHNICEDGKDDMDKNVLMGLA